MSTVSQAPAAGSQPRGAQWAANNAAASKLRWAELDSRNERLVTAADSADSVRAEPADSDRELRAS